MFNIEKQKEIHYAVENFDGIGKPIKTTGTELNSLIMKAIDVNNVRSDEQGVILVVNLMENNPPVDGVAKVYNTYYISSDSEALIELLEEVKLMRIQEYKNKIKIYEKNI